MTDWYRTRPTPPEAREWLLRQLRGTGLAEVTPSGHHLRSWLHELDRWLSASGWSLQEAELCSQKDYRWHLRHTREGRDRYAHRLGKVSREGLGVYVRPREGVALRNADLSALREDPGL